MSAARYPYETRDLFAEPEHYFFAPCSDDDFLEAWCASRERALARLSPADGIAPARPIVSDNGAIALRDLLAAAQRELGGGLPAEPVWDRIEPFVHKYEVFKRLFSHYGPGLRRHPDAVPASYAEYLQLADCLASIAERTSLLQPVSTLLKLCDALCSVGASPYSAAELHLLAEVIARERALVGRWR